MRIIGGSVLALAVLAVPAWAGPAEEARTALDQGDPGAALRILAPAAEAGDAEAERSGGAAWRRRAAMWWRSTSWGTGQNGLSKLAELVVLARERLDGKQRQAADRQIEEWRPLPAETPRIGRR